MSRQSSSPPASEAPERVLDELFLIRLRYSERGLIEARRDHPFVLDTPGLAWVVYSGSVDVFATQMQDGRPCGSRQHRWRVEAGQALFGMDLTGRDTGLLVVGNPTAQLIKAPLSRLQDLAAKNQDKDALAVLVEDWVTSLSQAIVIELPATDCLKLQAGPVKSLDAGVSASTRKQILWVRPAGSPESCPLAFCHLPARLLDPGVSLPLSKHTWVKTSQALSLVTLDTLQWLDEDPRWQSLAAFHSLAVEGLSVSRLRAEQEQRQSQQLKAEHRHAAVAGAMRSMASILEGEQGGLSIYDQETGALLQACRLVCQAQGITLTAPSHEQIERQKHDRLSAIVHASGVRTRLVYLSPEWWKEDHGPLLGYLSGETKTRRPVALLPDRPGYHMVDPRDGRAVRLTAPLAAALEERAVMFYRPFPEFPLTVWEMLRFGLRSAGLDLGFMLGMAAAASFMALFIPLATGWLYSLVIPNIDWGLLGFLALAWLACAAAAAAFQVSSGLAQLRLEGRLQLSLEAALWSRLMSLPASFFRRFTAGDLAIRAFSMGAIRRTLTGATTGAILSSLFSIFSLFLMFYYDAHLALAAVALAALAMVTTFTLTSRQVRNRRAELAWEGRLGALVLQLLNGVAKLRVAGAEEWAFTLWANHFTQQKRAGYQARRAAALLAVFNAAFSTLSTLVFFALAARRVAAIPAATFLAFSAAYGQFQASLLSLGLLFTSVQTIRLLFERARPILEAVPEVETSHADPGQLTGRIEISHLSYRYCPSTPLVLNDLSLSIEPGEFVAIVGPSGSGKSTLFRLLLKFETPLSGAIYYDGQDLAGLNIDAVRRQVGVVLQTGRLMPGSIFSNIVGALPLPQEAAWEAVRMVGLEDYIKSLPMGMQTVVSEGGSTFSGGQRQRLMIARAIVARPRILLFDEATSALDSTSQAVVSKNLENLQATRLVIAHRLSTIAQADHIYVLDKGAIQQSGTYDELMRRPGPFADLVKRQM